VVFLGIILLTVAGFFVAPRLLTFAGQVAMPTVTPVARPTVSAEELYLADAMISQPIRDGCRYDSPVPEMPMFLFGNVGEGRLAAYDFQPRTVLLVGWKDSEGEVCGIAAVFTFDQAADAHEIWQSLSKGLPGAQIEDTFDESGQAKAWSLGSSRGKYPHGAGTVIAVNHVVIWAMTYAESSDAAINDLDSWLSGFFDFLVSGALGAGQ